MRLGPLAVLLWVAIATSKGPSPAAPTSQTDDSGRYIAHFPLPHLPPFGRLHDHEPVPAHARVVGDMVLPQPLRAGPKFGGQGVASAHMPQRWPVGGGKIIIPYTLATTDTTVRGDVLKAIARWEDSACVVFVPYDPVEHTDYVEVTPHTLSHPCHHHPGDGRVTRRPVTTTRAVAPSQHLKSPPSGPSHPQHGNLGFPNTKQGGHPVRIPHPTPPPDPPKVFEPVFLQFETLGERVGAKGVKKFFRKKLPISSGSHQLGSDPEIRSGVKKFSVFFKHF